MNKVILFCISAVIIAALAGFLWYLGNLEMPEARIGPLSVISHARIEDLTEVGVVFPAQDEIKIRLTHAQIKKLYDRFTTDSPPTSLSNKWGFPYEARVQRKKDHTAPGGYYYDWMIYDVGKDGKLDEAQASVFLLIGSRP